MSDLDKMDKRKTTQIPKNNWNRWYDWLINYVLESTKKFESKTKQNVMRSFESKIYSVLLYIHKL